MKRALLVAIDAYTKVHALRGCVDDTTAVAEYLCRNTGFAPKDVRLLTDSRATKQGILSGVNWLITGAAAGDILVFYYSGHGCQLPSYDARAEPDGLDECICPVEFDWTDALRDKDFSALFSRLPDGAKLVWISDSCHSGDLEKGPDSGIEKSPTAPADIAWNIRAIREADVVLAPLASTFKGAFMSACASDQKARCDQIAGSKDYHSVFTWFLLEALQQNASVSVIDASANAALALAKHHYSQRPQVAGPPSIVSLPVFEPIPALATHETESAYLKRVRTEGESAARAQDVLTVLRIRGVGLSGASRERILAEKDASRLARWHEKALVAASETDVLE